MAGKTSPPNPPRAAPSYKRASPDPGQRSAKLAPTCGEAGPSHPALETSSSLGSPANGPGDSVQSLGVTGHLVRSPLGPTARGRRAGMPVVLPCLLRST